MKARSKEVFQWEEKDKRDFNENKKYIPNHQSSMLLLKRRVPLRLYVAATEDSTSS